VIVLICLEADRPSRASRAALDLACSLSGSARLVVVTAGGPKDSSSLALARSCAACAQVVHIEDGALENADFMTMGMVLAETARHLEAGLVLTGERSDEEGQGLVPAALAHHLRAPLLSRVLALRPAEQPDRVETVVRSGGQRVTVASPLPLVVSVPPRAPAQTTTLSSSLREEETWGLERIGLAASRLVPRPELLGALVSVPAEPPREMTFTQASAALLRHR
jgi:electron transfer flavoprotein beta subunit